MRNLAVFVAVSCLTGAIAAAGCSSNNNAGTGATTTSHSSSSGAGGHTASSSSGNSSSGNSSSGNSSSGGTGGTGGAGGSNSGGPCYAGTAGYTALTAAPTPAPMLNACAATDISAFLTACITGTSVTACNNWFAANLAGGMADGGGAGTACGNCIFPADSSGNSTNTGPTYTVVIGTGSSAQGIFGPNYGGCIQLADTTNGAACAVAVDNANNCEEQACILMGTSQCDNADYQTCLQYVTSTGQGCAAANTSLSACTADDADGGAAQKCSPGTGNNAQATDFTYIINLFCGTG